MSGRNGEKPFDAGFGEANRYKPDDAAVHVTVEGVLCPGEVIGRNGPRAQVRFTLNDATYVRWFDADALLEDPGGFA